MENDTLKSKITGKRYWLRGTVTGLIVTAIILIALESTTKCIGACPKLSVIIRDIIFIYGLFIVGGAICGLILGLLYGKFKNRDLGQKL